METCLVNLVESGSKVLVCINGVFGGRMKSIVESVVGDGLGLYLEEHPDDAPPYHR
jgi:alanine-glyoxylate transaminase/serine-glyoxylate transaminase/serine-pyruvate transaminase